MTDTLVDPKWKGELLSLRDYKVVKFPKLLQAVFYFLKFDREQVCEEGTNRLCWKKAKTLWDDTMLNRVRAYGPFGAKGELYKAYQTVNFVEKLLGDIEQEQIDAYSVALGRLHKWLRFAIDVRKGDVQRRKDEKERLKEEKEAADEQIREREERFREQLEKEKAEFEANLENEELEEGAEPPKFNEEEFKTKFEETYPAVEALPDVVFDIDNDYQIVPEESE